MINKIESVVQSAIDGLIRSTSMHNILSELQIQGYFFAKFEHELPSGYECIWEFPTRTRYKRIDGRLVLSNSGRSGSIDFVFLNEDGPVGGIEVEFPTEKGRIPKLFMNHIMNDARKLEDEIPMDTRYLLVFSYHQPQIALDDIRQDLASKVKFQFVELIPKSQQRKMSDPAKVN